MEDAGDRNDARMHGELIKFSFFEGERPFSFGDAFITICHQLVASGMMGRGGGRQRLWEQEHLCNDSPSISPLLLLLLVTFVCFQSNRKNV